MQNVVNTQNIEWKSNFDMSQGHNSFKKIANQLKAIKAQILSISMHMLPVCRMRL